MACPSLWNAFTGDDRYFYIRYRRGKLRVDETTTEEPETIFKLEIGHPLDGVMKTGEMIALVDDVLDFSECEDIVSIELDEDWEY